MDSVLVNQLHDFAVAGYLPEDGNIKRAMVDLTDLYPLFLSEIVPTEEGPYATEAMFLRYLYTSNNAFWALIKNKPESQSCKWFTGRLFGGGNPGKPMGPYGLSSARVMIVAPKPYQLFSVENTFRTVLDLTPMATSVRERFRQVLLSVGFSPYDIASWYMTSLVKFSDPTLDETLPAAWIKGCYPWLLQEIGLLKPDYIICAGSQVLKKFLGNSAKIKNYTGRLVDHEIVINQNFIHKCKLLSIPSFGFEMNLDVEPTWYRQLRMLYDDYAGIEKEKEQLRHVVVKNARCLQKEINRVKYLAQQDPKRRIIAVDLEWEGSYPQQEGAHVLTVQFSSAPGEATVVLLSDKDKVLFEEGVDVAAKLLETLFTEQEGWKPRLGGHFLRADMPWLLSLGISEIGLKHAYQPAETPEKCRDDGGWDTGLMYHACREDEEVKDGYGLKALALNECGIQRYDIKLQEELNAYEKCVVEKQEIAKKLLRYERLLAWFKDHCSFSKKIRDLFKESAFDVIEQAIKKTKAEKKALPSKRKAKGFGCILMDTLKPYAAWDADATRRLAELCIYGMGGRPALLDDDGYGNSCWEAFWRSHRASWGFGEMERTGFMLDVDRLDKLSHLFQSSYAVLLESFNHEINWPDFNPNSSDQRRGLLFGREQSKKKDGTYSMPEEAISFNLTPIRATDKTVWEEIDDDLLENYSASTDSLSLSIFAQDHAEVRKFFDICKLGRSLAGNIRPPVDTAVGDDVYTTWDKGIYTYLREDGRVHTHLSQTKKTGRASSFDPPMQNIGKSAEAILQNILGYKDKDGEVIANYPDLFKEPRYLYPCRTILRAAPGNVLIESDFTGAELAVMAWASGDPNMIEHVRRNALPEDDPDYYDIHSHIAVRAFHLDCEPTKKGLASIHKKHLRVAAKAVVFGIPYGRGVKAIRLQCQGDGVYLSEDEGNALLQSYFTLYPMTRVFLDRCKQDIDKKRFVSTLFNRYRRFSWHLRDSELAKAKREACNAPIQGTVADSINNAIFNLMEYKEAHPELPFTLNMQIHDALVFECRAKDVKSLKQVIHKCMVDDNPVVVDGTPHYYGIDSECYCHWGEELTDEICQREYGLSLTDVV